MKWRGDEGRLSASLSWGLSRWGGRAWVVVLCAATRQQCAVWCGWVKRRGRAGRARAWSGHGRRRVDDAMARMVKTEWPQSRRRSSARWTCGREQCRGREGGGGRLGWVKLDREEEERKWAGSGEKEKVRRKLGGSAGIWPKLSFGVFNFHSF